MVDVRELATLSVRDLLRLHLDVLAQLERRNVIRTRNAIAGDLAASLVAVAFNGSLTPSSTKSATLMDGVGRRVQVKARTAAPESAGSIHFTGIRSWEADVFVFVVLDAADYGVSWAREVAARDARVLAKHQSHTNADQVAVSHLATIGRDVAPMLARAFDDLP